MFCCHTARAPITAGTVNQRVANPRVEAFLCDPKGGFWPDDYSKKNFPWVPYLFVNNVRRYRQSAAPERLMTDMA